MLRNSLFSQKPITKLQNEIFRLFAKKAVETISRSESVDLSLKQAILISREFEDYFPIFLEELSRTGKKRLLALFRLSDFDNINLVFDLDQFDLDKEQDLLRGYLVSFKVLTGSKFKSDNPRMEMAMVNYNDMVRGLRFNESVDSYLMVLLGIFAQTFGSFVIRKTGSLETYQNSRRIRRNLRNS